MGPRLARSHKLSSVAEAVGQTPLVRLERAAREAPSVEVYAKLEFANPGGSVKDQDSIDYCNKAGMAMLITGYRHFKH